MWVFPQSDAIHVLTESPTVLTLCVAEDKTWHYLITLKQFGLGNMSTADLFFTYTTMMSEK